MTVLERAKLETKLNRYQDSWLKAVQTGKPQQAKRMRTLYMRLFLRLKENLGY